MKICKSCGELKSLAEYYGNPSGRDGTRLECKDCTRSRRKRWYSENREREIERVREWQVANPESVRANMRRFVEAGKRPLSNRKSHLKRKYGLTLDDFAAMLASQGGGCAICGRAEADNVDHDHVSGLVRGILCWNCNIAIGQLEDNADRATAVSIYLERDDELSDLARTRVVALSS